MLSEAVGHSQTLHSGMQNAATPREGSLAKRQTMTYTFDLWPCKISTVNLMTQLQEYEIMLSTAQWEWWTAYTVSI